MSEIPLCEPCLDGNTRAYLEECIAANMVSSFAPIVERFEDAFARFVGARHAIACSSGTAAIHVALRLFAVGAGDEVFCPTLTFIAAANPILYERATPVLFDAESATWNGDTQQMLRELVHRVKTGARLPKVVLVVHILGRPSQFLELKIFCEAHAIPIVEDAAEALGARYTTGRFAERQVGTVGDVGCFSFNGNKVMTTGGGGMIVTNDAALAKRARHLTTQARIAGFEIAHDEVGYNYRMSGVAAAIGLAQLEKLPEFLAQKHTIAMRYDDAFATTRGIERPPRLTGAQASNWLYTIALLPSYGEDRLALHRRLAHAKIQSRPIWAPLHTLPMFKDVPHIGGGIAEDLHARALSLPSSVTLTREQQARVIDVVTRAHES